MVCSCGEVLNSSLDVQAEWERILKGSCLDNEALDEPEEELPSPAAGMQIIFTFPDYPLHYT